MPEDDDEPPQSLIQHLSENLSLSFLSRSRSDNSDREAREWDRLVVGYLCLLSQWLWEDPKAVREFLEAGGLGVVRFCCYFIFGGKLADLGLEFSLWNKRIRHRKWTSSSRVYALFCWAYVTSSIANRGRLQGMLIFILYVRLPNYMTLQRNHTPFAQSPGRRYTRWADGTAPRR